MVLMTRARQAGWIRIGALLLAGLLLLAALGLGYVITNPNVLKPLIADLTERYLDRRLVVAGELTLELATIPRLTAREVTFANAPGGSAPYMASARFVAVQIDLGALFDNHVRLVDLVVEDAEVFLEDPVDGTPNWSQFPDDGTAGADWSFMLEALHVSSSRIEARIGELAPMIVEIPVLAQLTDPTGMVDLVGSGTFNGDPWRLAGRYGTFEAFLAGGSVSVDLALELDDAELSLDGQIGELATLSGLNLGLSVYGPDADVLGELFAMPDIFDEDIALEASIEPRARGYALAVQGHVSRFQITTSGTILNLAEFDGWDGSVDIRGPDAGVFGKALQIEGFPDGPFTITGTLHRHGGDLDLANIEIVTEDFRFLMNADFEAFPRREGAVASIQLTGEDLSEFRTLLGVDTLPESAFELDFSLDASGDEVLESSLRVGTHELSAAGPIGEFPDWLGTRLTLRLTGEDFAEVLRVAGQPDVLRGPYRGDAELRISDAGMQLNELRLTGERASLEGEVTWPVPSALTALNAQAAVEMADLSAFAAKLGYQGLPADPLAVTARAALADSRLTIREGKARFRTLTLDFSTDMDFEAGFSGTSAGLRLEGQDIDVLFNNALRFDDRVIPFVLEGNVRGAEEALLLEGLTLTTAGGTLQANGTVTFAEAFVGTEIIFQGSGANLAALLPDFPQYAPPQNPWVVSGGIKLPTVSHLELLDTRLEVGTSRLAIAGILDAEDQTRTDLVIQASGDSLKDIGQPGEAPWPDVPFALAIKLDGTMDALNVTQAEANWGDSDLVLSGNIDLTDKPFFTLKGRSSTMILVDLQKALFGEREDIEPEDDLVRFFPDSPLPMEDFALFDASIDIEIDKFRGRRSSLDDVNLRLQVEAGELRLERAAFRDNFGYFDAQALFRPVADGVYVEFKLLGEDADLGLFTHVKQAPETVPRYSLDVDIYGQGLTVADIAAGLNGKILIHSDGGEINNALLNAFTGDFLSNVLEVLNPFVATEEFTPMECMVVNAAVKDGKLKLEPGFVMRTDRVNMFVYGGVNLATEKLDLSLATQARRGIGISAASITNPYFKVGGTLVEPALQLDPASAAVAASVATATAGLSILVRGVWDRLMGTQNPCPGFLNYQRKEG